MDYTNYRNFEQVIQKARMACFNSVHRVEDHFVDVNEMIDIGRVSRCCGWHQPVGCQRDLFQFTEKRRVEELEKTGEAEQWVSASFGGEGDGGSPFEAVAIVVGELQEDFRVTHGHGLAGHALSGAGGCVAQVDAEQRSIVGVEVRVVRACIEQSVIGPRESGLSVDDRHGNERAWAKQPSLK